VTSTGHEDILRRYGEDAASWLDEQTADTRTDDALESARGRNRLDALRAYDPTATLTEELTVVLSGDRAQAGMLEFDVGDALLRPLQDGVTAFADRQVALVITGLSHGSTVLHVRATPEPADQVTEPDAIAVDSSHADLAVRQFVKVVDLLEQGLPLDGLGSRVRGLERLVGALDKFDLDMALQWHAFNGDTRSARLGRQGRSHFAELMRTTTEEQSQTINGRVTELREAGVFKVKSSGGQNSPAYDVRVEPGQLLEMHLQLGQSVHVRVARETQVDRTGTARPSTYRFLRFEAHPQTLDDQAAIDQNDEGLS